jgi:hypothetical protein
MRLASGLQVRRQAKGCDGQLTEAWMEHLGAGVAEISPAGNTARSRGRGRVWEGTGRRSVSGA